MTSSTLAATATQTGLDFWTLVGLILIGWILLMPFFPRRIGGMQAKGGGPGGSEKAIVGVIWVLTAFGLAVYLASGSMGSAAVG